MPPALLQAYLNVYHFLYERISDETVIPKLKDSELIDVWISNRNWLMIPPKDCFNREMARISPYPNIWISISDNLERMACGLHWAQANSVANLLDILSSLNYRSREKLRNAFQNLKKDYTIITQRKTHQKGLAPAAPADFEKVKRWDLKGFNSDCADEILQSVEEIKEEGRQLRENEEVEWAVPAVMIELRGIRGNDYESLLEVVVDYIRIMKVCHETLSAVQMRKIKRNLKKEFDYAAIKRKYEELRFFLKFNRITKEQFNQKIDELNEMIKSYNLAFNQNFELLNCE